MNRSTADSLISGTLNEVATLDRYQGMLYQWYDTANGHKIRARLTAPTIRCRTPTTVTFSLPWITAGTLPVSS